MSTIIEDEMRQQLHHVMKTTSINHFDKILTLPLLKDAHAYCKCNQLSGQLTGPLLEHYIKHKYRMTKNNASECNGDLNHNNTNIEIKVSCGGMRHNSFNYVQIRMNHTCEYILTAYYLCKNNIDNLGELFIFRLNKDAIKHDIGNTLFKISGNSRIRFINTS